MKKMLIALLGLLIVTAATAQIRGNNVVVTVTPDHKDWNYHVGENARFEVSVRKSSTLIDNVEVSYEAGPEMYPDVKRTEVLKDGTMKYTCTMRQPGFYRLKVTAKVGGREYAGAATAAFSPELLQPAATEPDDFDDFWAATLSQARRTALDPRRVLLPDRSNEEVNVYQVSFQNIRRGSRTYGILTVPVKPGKYPALLRVPGAGVRPYTGDTYTAPGKTIVLEIGIHGVDVTQPQTFYDDLANGALNGYWNFGTDNRDDCYYRRVIVGCVRAVDYIASLQQWDGKTIGVTGASQGGFLSYATAALDRRVTFLAAVHPALCDLTASLRNVACGWPHYFYWNKGKGMEKQVETLRYYDGVNFVRRVTCPSWVSFGYNDDVVPPTTAYATYNVLKGQKTLSVYQQTAHFWYQEQWDEWQAWMTEKLKNKTPGEQLAERLRNLQPKGYMMGHQDDPFYGVTWDGTYIEAEPSDSSDVLRTVGDYPAVMGFDLGGIELADTKNLDSVPFSRIRDELTAHHARGGIVTLSWHPRNPLTTAAMGGLSGQKFPEGTAWDVSDSTTVKRILPGGTHHELFVTWMERVADFIATLKTEDGKRVPIIFRPWHENNGSWFWWGQKLCTDKEFRSLWNMLQDYLNGRGLDNLLWSYSPNLDGRWTQERFFRRYPGNDRVTLIGEDAYQWGTERDFKTQLKADLGFLSQFAKDNGKLLAMTECGLQNMTDSTWWTRVLKPIMDEYPVSYFLLWRNYKKEYFGPAPELPCAEDFRRLYKAKNTLFLNDIINH